MPQDLPSLHPLPDNIDQYVRQLLPQQPRPPGLEVWLYELIRASGHLSTPDNLRWRVICLLWLAAEYEVDKAWPYLMWLNQGQPVMAEHMAEILTEAADDLEAHVPLANWMAQATDERLVKFWGDFQPVPARYTMPGLVSRLMAQPSAPETGVWLDAYCRATSGSENLALRPWRLLTATWYATHFDSTAGLAYLSQLCPGEPTLSAVDNKILTDLAQELNCLPAIIRWITACPNPAVKTMLKDFGHPDLPGYVAAIFQQPPAYPPVTNPAQQSQTDVVAFRWVVEWLEKAGVSLKTASLLNLACGRLAPLPLLLTASGCQATGADLNVPPAYLPTTGVKQWFKRGQYVKAWQTATAAYYESLAQQIGLKLKWTKVKIDLADLTRLPYPDNSFEGVICLNHLSHAPDVESLLAEAARVLRPGGVLIADLRPYAALTGAFSPPGTPLWAHLRPGEASAYAETDLIFNRWREADYRAALKKRFTIEQWQSVPDERAIALLTPALRVELADYDETELTCQQWLVRARKD